MKSKDEFNRRLALNTIRKEECGCEYDEEQEVYVYVCRDHDPSDEEREAIEAYGELVDYQRMTS